MRPLLPHGSGVRRFAQRIFFPRTPSARHTGKFSKYPLMTPSSLIFDNYTQNYEASQIEVAGNSQTNSIWSAFAEYALVNREFMCVHGFKVIAF
jgi:hypothetical protein